MYYSWKTHNEDFEICCAYTQLQIDCLVNRAGYSKPSEDTHLCTCHVLAYTINHHRSCSHNCPRYFCICIPNTGRPACLCIHPHLGNSQKRTFEECLIIYFVSQTKENDMLLTIYKDLDGKEPVCNWYNAWKFKMRKEKYFLKSSKKKPKLLSYLLMTRFNEWVPQTFWTGRNCMHVTSNVFS